MSGFTPGPWSAMPLITQGLTFAPIVATTLIAKVYSTAYGDHGQATANAQLMAAAPDLYKALKRIVLNPDAQIGGDMRAEAIAALAKAEGES